MCILPLTIGSAVHASKWKCRTGNDATVELEEVVDAVPVPEVMTVRSRIPEAARGQGADPMAGIGFPHVGIAATRKVPRGPVPESDTKLITGVAVK